MVSWKDRRVWLLCVFGIGILSTNVAAAASSGRARRAQSCPGRAPKLETILQHVKDLGGYYPGDNGQPLGVSPHWLDVGLLRTGQKFARDNLAAVFFTEFQGLFLLFLLDHELSPLIFTGASDTPEEAFYRYRSTVFRVLSWYDQDLLDKNSQGFNNLLRVRSFHSAVRKRITSASREEVANRSRISGGMWCPFTARLRKDFSEAICPYSEDGEGDVDKSREQPMSQKSMAYTQFGFVGLMFAYPEAYGVFQPDPRQFQGFAHLWAFVGHQLGIADEFNLCLGEIGVVQERMRQFVEHIAKPRLAGIKPEWEHMTRVMADGISRIIPLASFPVGLKGLLDIMGVPAPSLDAALTPAQRSTLAFYETARAMRRRGNSGSVHAANNLVRLLLSASRNITVVPRPPPRPDDCPAENLV